MSTDLKKDGVTEHVELEDPALNKHKGINQEQQAIYDAFAANGEEWKAQQNKALLRKVDLHLLPFLVALYLLNFLDRSNLAQARQGSLEEDLGMTGTDFNLATSILFVGYLPVSYTHLTLPTKRIV